tara:strand:+ start:89 stop:1045 length:957 start_codon:yes stop_codon:yes gene_type:complete
MATFEQIVEDASVMEEGNPFSYVKVEGDAEFTNPNTLRLEGDGAIFVNEDAGRLYLIVKTNREVDIRIRSSERNSFDGLSNYTTTAWNMNAKNPFFGGDSSLDLTLRGGSMLALVATDKGDRGVWDKSGTTFHLETVQRDITQPGGDYGLLLSLTAPYGDYADQQTQTVIFNSRGADFQVSIRAIRDAPSGGFNAGFTDFETTDPELVFDDSRSGRIPYDRIIALDFYATGNDADGRRWTVEIGQGDDGLFYVVVDDAVDTIGFQDRRQAVNAAELKVDALRKRTTLIEDSDGFGFELALGGLAVIAIILLIAIGGRR